MNWLQREGIDRAYRSGWQRGGRRLARIALSYAALGAIVTAADHYDVG